MRLDAEDLAVEIDDVEVAGLVDAEAGDVADRARIGREVGAAQDEAVAERGGADGEVADRQRPDVAVDEIAEEILALQPLDGTVCPRLRLLSGSDQMLPLTKSPKT